MSTVLHEVEFSYNEYRYNQFSTVLKFKVGVETYLWNP